MVLLFFSCSNYEKIGNYRYKLHIQRSNIGEFDALIKKYKVFVSSNNDTIFFSLIKAQKLDYETERDTVFAYGKIEVKKDNNKIFIITKEINVNGYENFTKIDSVVRYFEQINDGKVKFNKAVYYKDGQIKDKL